MGCRVGGPDRVFLDFEAEDTMVTKNSGGETHGSCGEGKVEEKKEDAARWDIDGDVTI